MELYETQSIDSNEPIARGAQTRTGTATGAKKKGKPRLAVSLFRLELS
jgi:hypothetical protein